MIRQRIVALIDLVRDVEYEQRFFVGAGLGMQVTFEPKWLGTDWLWYIGEKKGELSEQECIELLKPAVLDWKLGSSRQVERLFMQRAEGLRLRPTGQMVRTLPNRPEWIYFEVAKREGPAWRSGGRLADPGPADQGFGHRQPRPAARKSLGDRRDARPAGGTAIRPVCRPAAELNGRHGSVKGVPIPFTWDRAWPSGPA